MEGGDCFLFYGSLRSDESLLPSQTDFHHTGFFEMFIAQVSYYFMVDYIFLFRFYMGVFRFVFFG